MIASPLSCVIRKLEAHSGPFTVHQRAAILSLPVTIRDVKAGQDIVRQCDVPGQCCLVLAGLACRFKIVADGGRQIQSFHINGDMPDLHSLHLAHMDHTLGALRDCRLAFVGHGAVRQLFRTHPDLGQAFWRETLVDSAIFREWMSNIGRRDSVSRIAHLLCELLVRYRSMRLADDMTIPVRLLQGEVADAQGLSIVHTNRSLRALKADKLIGVVEQKFRVLDFTALAARGDFDPTYLHLRQLPDLASF